MLNVTGGYYIRFADKAVQDICAANWGDGIGITEAQAAATTSLSTKFKGNTTITEFMELSKFGTTAIAADGFLGCTNLIKADLSKISVLNSQAFRDCVNFAGDGNGDLRLPSLTSIDNHAFGGYNTVKCKGLKRVLDLGSITTLPDGANGYSGVFRNQINITEVHLPNTLKTIGSRCFDACTALVDINLTSSITSINTYAFYRCLSLAIVIDLPNLETLGQDAFAMFGSEIGSLIGIENLGKITTIPNAGSGNLGCFRNHKSLTYAKLPNTLTTIGSYAFYGCSALTSVNFPSSLITIGESAFNSCASLSGITLPPSIKTIGGSAFNGCTSLEIADLSLPNLESLASYAFVGVKITKISNLGKITAINPSNANTSNLGDKSILKEITLPNTIKTIGDYTFINYSALETITIEEGASGISVGSHAFYGLSSLVNFNINLGAFVSLGVEAFNSINILDEVTFSNVTTIKSRAFLSSSISKIKLPSIETMDGDSGYEGIFSYCKNLILVDIGANCTSIGSNSFGRFVGTSGNNITVVVRATTPPSLGGPLINNGWVNATVGRLYVPDASVNAYKTATNWSQYADIIYPLSEYVE